MRSRPVASSEREANVSATSLSFDTFLSAMRKKSTFIKILNCADKLKKNFFTGG